MLNCKNFQLCLTFATSPSLLTTGNYNRRRKRTVANLVIYIFFLFLLAFCFTTNASALKGKVMHHRHRQKGEEHGGVPPVVGSHVYMFAINTAGYGSPPISLLHGSGVTVDGNGNGYVVTDANGGFNLTGLYASDCPNPNSSVYLQAIGGDPGDGQNNSAIDLVTALPLICSQEPNASSVFISEETTVAAAWALVRYASLSPPSFSASTSNPQALLNAFAYANALVSGYSGIVSTTAYNGSLTVPTNTINSMSDILAECTNNGSASSACTQFFAYAAPPGGTVPTDVFEAAVDVALNPTNNAAGLFGLIPTSGAPFAPTLAAAPPSWSITYGVAAGSGAQGYSLTIDHTKVANSDQLNFPILVSTPPTTPLATTAYGGLVQSANGYDIVFSSDAAGQHLLDFETDNYNPTDGSGGFWVRVPNVSHTADTVIYMWYGIPNLSNSLQNALGVWSNNYLSVYHLGSGTTIGTTDSGIAGYDLLGTATPVVGQVGGAVSFHGDPTIYLAHDNVSAYPTGSNPATIEAWELQWGCSGNCSAYGVGYGNASAGNMFSLAVSGGNLYADYYSTGIISGPLPASGWHHLVDVYGGGQLSSTSGVYVDGALQSLYNFGGTPNILSNEFKIGGLVTTSIWWPLSGSVDEVRVSSGTRSADWIATEYSNQSSPNTFLTMQPAQLAPGTQSSTITTLSSSSSPSQYGSSILLTATVSSMSLGSGSLAPTGQVAFYDGPTNVGVVALTSMGTALFPTANLPVGTHPITAVYSGDGNYAGSTSSAFSEVVSAVFNPVISCAPSRIVSGEKVTCAVTLIAGASSPVGFNIGSSGWTTAVPNQLGVAVAYAAFNATPGLYNIAFNYPGDPNIPAASGSAQVDVYNPGRQPSGTTIYSFSISDQNGNSGYAPNGNVVAYSDTVNGTWTLGNDGLNRLTWSSSTSAMGLSQSGCWAYDSFGNMLTQGISNQPFTDTTNCVAQSGATTLQSHFSYSSANQISSGTWLDGSNDTHTGSPSYDPSGNGNMTSDLLDTYLYDAANNVCAVQTGQGAFMGYLYDAEGHRVAKTTLASLTCDPAAITAVTSTYFIGPDGETMTEMSGTGQWVRTEVSAAGQYLATYKPDGIHYPVTDWLGTKRMTVNPNIILNSGIEETCISFPFGDQQNCNTTDASPRHFTGKERDTESGLDYFGARYYASSMGRWMSPDWADKPEAVPYSSLDNPQTLNLYGYVGNNPLSRADADGHVWQWLQKLWNVVSYPGIMNDPKLSPAQRDAAMKQAWADHDAAGKELVTTSIQLIGVVAEAESPMGAPPTLAEPAAPTSPDIHPSEISGKSPSEIDATATGKGLIPKGPDPMNGKGSYVDPVTGQQRVLSHPDADPPHAHVNNPAGERLGPNGQVVPNESPEAHLPIKKDPPQ